MAVYIPPVVYTYKYPQVQNEHMMKVVEKYPNLTDRARLSVIQMMGISNDEENQRIMESIKSSGLF